MGTMLVVILSPDFDHLLGVFERQEPVLVQTLLVELAGGQLQPAKQSPRRQLGPSGPALHVIDHGVTRVVGNPVAFQSSPLAFFARTFSSISSVMTSFFWPA